MIKKMLKFTDSRTLVVLVAALGFWGGQRAAPAQTVQGASADRERFLRLLLRREDHVMVQVLTRRKGQIEARLERLKIATPSNSRQARMRARGGQQLGQAARDLGGRIVQPPPSPLRRRLDRQAQAHAQQIRQIENRLQRLGQIVPHDPRRARQIERAISQLQQQSQGASSPLQFIERRTATPTAPSVAINVFGFSNFGLGRRRP